MRSRVSLISRIVTLSITCLFLVGTARAATFTVNVILDASDASPGDGVCATLIGNCSLRAAIEEANAFAGTDTIAFGIAGAGVKTIVPKSLYPTITEAITIDGWTQGGAGYNGSPLIELDGTNAVAGASGLTITAGNSKIRGLAINRYSYYGIALLTGGGNLIEGCYLGTDATGTVDLGNGVAGIFITSPNNLIGGIDPSKRNVISGNSNGIGIETPAATGNIVTGNYIGTDVTGSIDLGNSGVLGGTGIGISVGGPNNRIGGTLAGEGNVISGNGGGAGASSGVSLADDGNTVIGNFIGTDASGTIDLGNSGVGFRVTSSNNKIGGALAGEANTIAFNDIGIAVYSGTGNAILGNHIFSNDNLGISFSTGVVTANDAGDADAGANNLQNFPALASASNKGGSTKINGSLDSTISTSFTIEFFSSSSCDSSGNGEGKSFLGSKTVTTHAAVGATPFTFTPVNKIPVGRFITTTATRNSAPLDTSEFSPCVKVK